MADLDELLDGPTKESKETLDLRKRKDDAIRALDRVRSGSGQQTSRKKDPASAGKKKRPNGVSQREVQALAKAAKTMDPEYCADDAVDTEHPIVLTDDAGLAQKRALSARVPHWVFKPFTNGARGDGLQLRHWARETDVRTEYAFERFNVAPDVVRYDDQEYSLYCDDPTRRWSRELTDRLFELLRSVGLRFHVVADRLGADMSVDDVKERYYSICRRLCVAEAGSERAAESHPIMRVPFDKEYETLRKAQFERRYQAPRENADEIAYLKSQLAEIQKAEKDRAAELRVLRDAVVNAAAVKAAKPLASRAQAVASVSRKRGRTSDDDPLLDTERGAAGRRDAASSDNAPNVIAVQLFPDGAQPAVVGIRGRAPLPSPAPAKGRGGRPSKAAADDAAALAAEASMLEPAKKLAKRAPGVRRTRLRSSEVTLPPCTGTVLSRVTALMSDLNVPMDPLCTDAAVQQFIDIRQRLTVLVNMHRALALKEEQLEAARAKYGAPATAAAAAAASGAVGSAAAAAAAAAASGARQMDRS